MQYPGILHFRQRFNLELPPLPCVDVMVTWLPDQPTPRSSFLLNDRGKLRWFTQDQLILDEEATMNFIMMMQNRKNLISSLVQSE